MAIHMMTGSTQQYWCLRQRVNEHEYVKPVIMWQVGEDVMVRAAPMGQTLGRLAKAARFQQLDSDGYLASKRRALKLRFNVAVVAGTNSSKCDQQTVFSI